MNKNYQTGRNKSYFQKNKKTSQIPKPIGLNFFYPKLDIFMQNKSISESLDIDEMQALHVLIGKANNMTQEELEIKKTIETHKIVPNGTFCVILNESEAVKICYGNKGKESWKFKAIRKGFNKLCQKKRTVYLPVPEKAGNFVITTLNFLDETEELGLSTNCKKYRAFYIPEAILFLHKNYGYFNIPTSIFDYLRNIPPDGNMTRELAVVSYFIFSEINYKNNKKNIIKRKKQKFIQSIVNELTKKNRHIRRFTKSLETIYFPKLKNLGVIESWEIYSGPTGDVYKITITAKKQLQHLFN